jgi:hypothetical protein
MKAMRIKKSIYHRVQCAGWLLHRKKCIASEWSHGQISFQLFSVFQSFVLLIELFKFQNMWSVHYVGDDGT